MTILGKHSGHSLTSQGSLSDWLVSLGMFRTANGNDIKRAMNALDKGQRVTIAIPQSLRKAVLAETLR